MTGYKRIRERIKQIKLGTSCASCRDLAETMESLLDHVMDLEEYVRDTFQAKP